MCFGSDGEQVRRGHLKFFDAAIWIARLRNFCSVPWYLNNVMGARLWVGTDGCCAVLLCTRFVSRLFLVRYPPPRLNHLECQEILQQNFFKHVKEPTYQVFLGGACNPTTWRKEVAIPVLDNAGITYYNPQVEKWNPMLMEVEEQAKQSSSILLFVVDNLTRGIASMVEIGYMLGQGREAVVVVKDFSEGAVIASTPLPEREIHDLNRGHDYICFVSFLERVPIFEDMSSALGCITKLVQTVRNASCC